MPYKPYTGTEREIMEERITQAKKKLESWQGIVHQLELELEEGVWYLDRKSPK